MRILMKIWAQKSALYVHWNLQSNIIIVQRVITLLKLK